MLPELRPQTYSWVRNLRARRELNKVPGDGNERALSMTSGAYVA